MRRQLVKHVACYLWRCVVLFLQMRCRLYGNVPRYFPQWCSTFGEMRYHLYGNIPRHLPGWYATFMGMRHPPGGIEYRQKKKKRCQTRKNPLFKSRSYHWIEDSYKNSFSFSFSSSIVQVIRSLYLNPASCPLRTLRKTNNTQ